VLFIVIACKLVKIVRGQITLFCVCKFFTVK